MYVELIELNGYSFKEHTIFEFALIINWYLKLDSAKLSLKEKITLVLKNKDA